MSRPAPLGRHRRRGRGRRAARASVPLAVGSVVAGVTLIGAAGGGRLLHPDDDPSTADPRERHRASSLTVPDTSTTGHAVHALPVAASASPRPGSATYAGGSSVPATAATAPSTTDARSPGTVPVGVTPAATDHAMPAGTIGDVPGPAAEGDVDPGTPVLLPAPQPPPPTASPPPLLPLPTVSPPPLLPLPTLSTPVPLPSLPGPALP